MIRTHCSEPVYPYKISQWELLLLRWCVHVINVSLYAVNCWFTRKFTVKRTCSTKLRCKLTWSNEEVWCVMTLVGMSIFVKWTNKNVRGLQTCEFVCDGLSCSQEAQTGGHKGTRPAWHTWTLLWMLHEFPWFSCLDEIGQLKWLLNQ